LSLSIVETLAEDISTACFFFNTMFEVDIFNLIISLQTSKNM